MDFDPAYQGRSDETVTIIQHTPEVDYVSTLAYGAIDETNWGGLVLWGIPPLWSASDLHSTAWLRPLGGDVVTDAEYDAHGGSDGSPGNKYRGAVDLAPGRYEVSFHAAWQMQTAPRAGATSGHWGARSTLGSIFDRWENYADPNDNQQPIALPPSDGSDQLNFEQTVTATFDTRQVGVTGLFNTIGILGPTMWGRILKNTFGCTLTITRRSDYVPVPPEGLVAGPIRYGSLRRERPR